MNSPEPGSYEFSSAVSRIDTSVAHPARRYDYWLGGKDNFAADRESGEAVAAAFPTIRMAALENRGFLRRAVTYLAKEAGIRQFLDIGSGLPTSPNVHEIAQAITPAARVVYADNDPIVLAHARALLNSSREGATAYLDADLHEPEKILDHPELRATLDLSQPVALTLVAILHFFPDDQQPYEIVSRLVNALPSGSYLVMSHATVDYATPQAIKDINAGRYGTLCPRSRDEFAHFFTSLELVPPGIVSVAEWGAENDDEPRPTVADVAIYGGVGRLP
ncbi:MAG TPA: SAM-dependent methyltransferase [Rugosimonospora sp.]|jgi:hypothetical protein